MDAMWKIRLNHKDQSNFTSNLFHKNKLNKLILFLVNSKFIFKQFYNSSLENLKLTNISKFHYFPLIQFQKELSQKYANFNIFFFKIFQLLSTIELPNIF